MGEGREKERRKKSTLRFIFEKYIIIILLVLPYIPNYFTMVNLVLFQLKTFSNKFPTKFDLILFRFIGKLISNSFN